MTKILNNKYILYAILCVLLVGVALTFFVRSTETASADYQDIVNDTTALVNFNQIINPADNMTQQYYTYSNGTYFFTSYSGWINTNGPFNVISGHKYFIHSICNTDSSRISFTNNVDYGMFNHVANYIDILVPQQTKDNMLLLVNPNGVECSITLYLIDISVMFGIGNEPNLQECQELFVADYYAYNSGSAVSLSGLNSYANGYNDASSSYTTITTSYDSYAQIFDAGASYFVKQANSNGTSFTGRVGFYLGFTAQAGTSLDISLNYFLVHNTADLQIGYVTNGSFVPLFSGIRDVWSPHSSGLGYTAKIHLTLPVAVSYLYLYSYVSSVSDNPACILGSYEITYTAYDYQSAVIDAEKNGYSRAENLYKPQLESYTSETGTGYQNIYNNGYQDGLNAQVSEARKKTYTFTNFLGALFDVPVTTLKSLLDFNFLGFNLKNFVFSILTLSIVFAIIKLILVKTGDSK